MCLASLDRITYSSRGHTINLEIQRPAGRRPRDHLFRRSARSGPGAGSGHARPPADAARAAAADRDAGIRDPLGPAGRRVGRDRRGPPGPDVPAARRSVPARPVATRAAHRDTGGQLRRGRVREQVPFAARAARTLRGGLLHRRSRLLLRPAHPSAGPHRVRSLGGPHRSAERAAQHRAGVLLREPGRGDRRHAASSARADLRVPVRHPAHRANGGAGPGVTTAATCSTTWSPPNCGPACAS